MFRHKDRMLNDVRKAKKKNTNKEGKEEQVNEKDLHRFELKGIQQELIKEGIRVHMNDLRAIRHITLDELDEEERKNVIGNTTMEVLLEKMNSMPTSSYGFGGNSEVIAKTHDMTRWKEKKKKTVMRQRERNEKNNLHLCSVNHNDDV